MSWKLEQHPSFPGIPGPVIVCVMDGVGIGRRDESDAVWLAQTPNLDALSQTAPSVQLNAHGCAVGMPSDADMGNSEVGHNAIGAGRIFDQGAKLVAQAIASGEMFKGQTWQDLGQRVRSSGESMHFVGLLSDGNVHSHIDHLFAMIERCDAEDVQKVRIHILTDGRDVGDHTALEYVDALEKSLNEINQKKDRDYKIASGGGRMVITMDRYEAEWDMVERGWQTHVLGQARAFKSAREAILTLRDENPGVSDQYIPPFVIANQDSEPIGKIKDGSAVILFNFRGDRAIEISQAFESDTFTAFNRGSVPDTLYAGMMQYDGDLRLPKRYLVQPPAIDRTLGEYLALNGIPQLAISETQKFGHVTFFWNGNRSGYFDEENETYIEIPSDVLPFDERPQMKAEEITNRAIEELLTGRHRHARINFANGDMVGHTGHREAATKAVEVVDQQIGRLLAVTQKLNGALLVTADHGNADCMFMLDPKTGTPVLSASGTPKVMTSHTLNPVPLHVYAPGQSLALRAPAQTAGLDSLAATVLHLLGLRAPSDFSPSLIRD
ncbi:MAG: phosphoglycerate mutase (2,3-diphosphoglycerate-independent) [Deltaproteobacteria bacterium]|nr:phosphoglycerate mutase (2,3-diphosphoglycerate-independent) [Deltaproteobacteria bacterium]